MNVELLNWLKQQHAWLGVAAEQLMREGQLSDVDVAGLVQVIKDPKKAEAGEQPIGVVAPPVVPAVELRLLSLGPVEGIDALAPRSPLSFGSKNLSVVYGHNGAGKSSYTRIILKACGKPHVAELRGNVFAAPAARQGCKIKYSLGGVESEIAWVSPTPAAALAPIDIFDSTCGRTYLENETEAAFMPPELALLSDLVNTCGRVEAVLSAEERLLASRLPVILPTHVGTTAANNYGGIRYDLTEQQIASLVEWTEQQSQEMEQIDATLAIADPLPAAEKRRVVKRQLDGLVEKLAEAITQLTGAGYETSRRLFITAEHKRRVAREAAGALAAASTIDGVGSDTWRAMWTAAREFSTKDAHPEIPFPFVGEGARCVFCMQELDADASKRLTEFEAYVSGAIEKEATTAEAELHDHLNTIVTRPAPENLMTSCLAAELDRVDTDLLENLWGALEKSLCSLRAGQCPDSAVTLDKTLWDFIEKLRRLALEAEEVALALTASANQASRKSAEASKKELLAQKWVSEQADAIKAEVQRLKQVHDIQQWKRQTATTGLSRKATELSQALVTDDYIGRFNSELRQLGATAISVELVRTRAERGRVKHGIRLRNAVARSQGVSEILSDGERRIVALAAFLADVTGRDTPTPFIFDDPISSLDQSWEEKTIDRVISLSQSRQVIIFTHRLSLLGIITDKADDDLHAVHISREPWGTGQPGDVPLFGKRPDKALSNLKNDRLAKAKRTFNEEGGEAYYPFGKAICSDLRILTERIVELIFLADVVQRHRRAVHTDGKIHQLAKITLSDCAMIDELMTKYSCYEHSQSYEAPVAIPDPDDIGSDIDRLLAWHNEFKDRVV